MNYLDVRIESMWCSIGDLNPEPSGYEPDTLPIELMERILDVDLRSLFFAIPSTLILLYTILN